MCSPAGPPGALPSAGPLTLGMKREGQNGQCGTVLGTKLRLHLGKPIPSPFPPLFSYLQKESCCFSPSCFPWNSPFLSPTPSQPPLRHCRDLPLSIHSQHCALWEPRSLSVSGVNLVFGWLKQGGQSPLDPKGAPISRDVSSPGYSWGRRVGVTGEGDDGRCCPWCQEGREEAESIFSSPVVLTYGSPGRLLHHSVFSIGKCSSRAITTPPRVRPRLPVTWASHRVLRTPSCQALA